jgi:dethiobiotin synthetase
MIYFVTAIHTDSGKTLVSAIIAKALQADYWKPIQCGIEPRDSVTVVDLINNNHVMVHDEAYVFTTPASPHAAAELEDTVIDLANINLPTDVAENLVIEGAGGIMVPLNSKQFIIDIAEKFDAEIILVSNNYLGSINHTVLTINEIRRRNLKVKGIIFNGKPNLFTEEFILNYSGYNCLLKIDEEKKVDDDMVNKYAVKLFENWED